MENDLPVTGSATMVVSESIQDQSVAEKMRLCVLGSGSSGNCTYVGTDVEGILIDAGLSYKETDIRLREAGISTSAIKAICVTHEHHDHVSSLGVLYRKLGVGLYGNSGTIQAIETKEKLRGLKWNVFVNGSAFSVGSLRVEPFSVPHDAYDPVGFVICKGDLRVGVVTDMGTVTELIRQRLMQCQVVVIECNHDGDLLKGSARPWTLKQRIQSRQGHLSNEQAVAMIKDIACSSMKAIYLAHLSSDCNKPESAVACARKAVADSGFDGIDVKLTYADRISEIFVIE